MPASGPEIRAPDYIPVTDSPRHTPLLERLSR